MYIYMIKTLPPEYQEEGNIQRTKGSLYHTHPDCSRYIFFKCVPRRLKLHSYIAGKNFIAGKNKISRRKCLRNKISDNYKV